MSSYDAILPAGGQIDDAFAAKVGTKSKALIPFEGRTILERTIEALRASNSIERIALIGPDEVLNHPAAQQADLRLTPLDSGPDNIYKGLQSLTESDQATRQVVVSTTDMPFLTPEMINGFLDLCPPGREVCVPLVSGEAYEARFPGSTATFVMLADGKWTTGGVFRMDVAAMQRIKPAIDRVFRYRKSKVGMARILGPGFLLKFLTKRLTVADIESKIVSMLGCTGAAIPGCAAELAYDIDYVDDYDYAIDKLGLKP